MTAAADRLRSLLTHPNVAAFLRVLREGESSQEDRAYFVRWPGKTFYDLGRHPRIFEPGPNGPSSAAGAYQITATTYDDFAPKLGITDFSRESQDILALSIIDKERALLDVLDGDPVAAIRKLGGRWASLPSSDSGQPTLKLERLLDVYRRSGGTFTQAPAAPAAEQGPSPPPPPRPVPAPAPTFPAGSGDDPFPVWPFPKSGGTMPLPVTAAVALGAELLKLLPMFGSGSKSSDRNLAAGQALGGKLLELAKEVAPSEPNEQARVEAILSSPELQTRFRAQAAAKWDDLAPFMEFESRERKAARDFAATMTGEGPVWRQIGYGALVGLLSLVIVGGIGYIFWNVLFAEASSFSQSTRDGIVEVAKNILILVVGFFFGSSASNRQKDQTIEQQSRR